MTTTSPPDNRNHASNNLSNGAGDHTQPWVEVTCEVMFEVYGPVPKANLQNWLAALPEDARVGFTHVAHGKAVFQAKWKEHRTHE